LKAHYFLHSNISSLFSSSLIIRLLLCQRHSWLLDSFSPFKGWPLLFSAVVSLIFFSFYSITAFLYLPF